MSEPASREITQRELRNDSGSILRAVEAGATFVVTRNGTPIAELHPLRRRTFIPITQVMAMFGHDAAIDPDKFFGDLDEGVDQGCSVTDLASRWLLDTNVIVHLPGIDPEDLPLETAARPRVDETGGASRADVASAWNGRVRF